MKMIYLMGIGLLGLAESAVAQTVPVASDYSDYTGDSFVANWSALAQGETGYLSVFAPSSTVRSVNESFGSINATDGKIDTANPGYPAGWIVAVSENGSVDMRADGGVNKVVFDATGDYIQTEPVVGSGVAKFVIDANIINADGITEDNSSRFIVDIYDKSGERITGGAMYAVYFGTHSTLDLFADALTYTPANIGSIKISLEKEDGMIGDLMINSLSYEYAEPDYVLENRQVEGTSYLVSNLDAEKEYYYYLKSGVGDDLSAASNIVRVNPFLTPTATAATVVSKTSYTANWDYLPKAKGYLVQNYRYEVATEASTTEVLSDDFSKATEGTVDEPVSVSDIDDYTAVSGWTGKNVLASEGMLGADAGRFPMNLSYLQTPSIDLSSNGGHYTVHIRAVGTAGDYLSIYRVGYMVDTDGDGVGDSLNIHQVYFNDEGVAEEAYEMEDGATNMVLSIEESGLRKFFVDEIAITQERAAGDVSITPLEQVAIEGGENTSYTFTGLESGATYAYEVTGIRDDDYQRDEYSQVSNLVVVDLSLAGVAETADSTSGVEVRVSGNVVTVSLAAEMPISLVSLDGRIVNSLAGKVGENSFEVSQSGVYILRVGEKSYKIYAR